MNPDEFIQDKKNLDEHERFAYLDSAIGNWSPS